MLMTKANWRAADHLCFRQLAAADLLAIEPQDSQRQQYGLDVGDMDPEHAAALAGEANSWAVLRGDTVLACIGISQTFPGVQGVAWALLSRHMGRDVVPVTDFTARVMIAGSPLQRIEAIVRSRDIPAHFAADNPRLLFLHAMAAPTPQVRWAIKVGLHPVHVMRKFGAAGEAHMLMERIN
jgi:hypothetical protein